MINGGNNGGGNPNHDENGRFTSGPNQAGNKVEEKQDYESKVKEQLGIKNDKEPSFEEKMQSTMGIKEPQKEKSPFDEAKKELQDMGATVVGEQGDRVTEVTTDGEKFYARTYRTNYNGPIDGTEEELQFKAANGEFVDGFDSVEEVIDALKKDGYAVYDEFKANTDSEQATPKYLKVNGEWVDVQKQQEAGYYYHVKDGKVYYYSDENGADYEVGNLEDQSDVDENKLKNTMGIQSPEAEEFEKEQIQSIRDRVANGETVQIGKYKFTPENLESDKMYHDFDYMLKKAIQENFEEQGKKPSKPFDLYWGKPDDDIVPPRSNGGK